MNRQEKLLKGLKKGFEGKIKGKSVKVVFFYFFVILTLNGSGNSAATYFWFSRLLRPKRPLKSQNLKYCTGVALQLQI